MATIHTLTKTGPEVAVVVHVAIPNTNNSAGTSWRTALINSGVGGRTILPDGDGTGGTISAAEKASLATGVLYEAQGTVRTDSVGAGAGPINAYLDAQAALIGAQAVADLQDRLRWFGGTR